MSHYQSQAKMLAREPLSREEKDERLVRHGWTVTDSGCWEWDGYRNPLGYGEVKIHYRIVRCNRLAYETWVGPIPEGHVVRHKCDNPPCINPEHLETGTPKQNTADMISRGRDGIRGERNGMCKVTSEQVDEIRARYAVGDISQRKLASEYGIAQSTVGRIIRGDIRVYG